ncbi:MAG: glucans biosynthesis glucosyltransferase MdoH, partial [Gemmatimonadetes bacterium]|nr:glucans biosynthesis glucosyltransferase MdoH [Gemmatimonadota bacterium]
AMAASLAETGRAHHFAIHLLSDTTDPAIRAAEDSLWAGLEERYATGLSSNVSRGHWPALHFRRREFNEGRKAGNIAEFCDRWRDSYDYMVVLDADSIMSGTALVELARMLDANPDVGLIQTVPLPARQRTLFGRLAQFAACVYSPLLATGQAFWQGDVGNYWGHNAIIRLGPFADHCKLPILPGRPPLGGDILSHDFVEAALLRRAGWKVYMVPWIEGSYEELPGNVLGYAKRDRRWAQGSLQHLRLLADPGLAWISRLHFVMGAMAYLSSPLWFVLLLASTAYVLFPGLSGSPLWESGELGGWWNRPGVVPLLAVTGVILFLPKVLGVWAATLRDVGRFGGVLRLWLSSFLEALFAVIVAPVMMVFHCLFVASIALGRDVKWAAQERDETLVGWASAVRGAWLPASVGIAWSVVAWVASPAFLMWLLPILLGLVWAIPLVVYTSSTSVGAAARRRGLFLVGSETSPSRTLIRAERMRRRIWRRHAPLTVAPHPGHGAQSSIRTKGAGLRRASSA